MTRYKLIRLSNGSDLHYSTPDNSGSVELMFGFALSDKDISEHSWYMSVGSIDELVDKLHMLRDKLVQKMGHFDNEDEMEKDDGMREVGPHVHRVLA